MQQITPNQVVTLINASTSVAAGTAIALPTKPVAIGVQFSVDVNAGSFSVNVEMSLDNVNWFAVKTMTATDLASGLVYVTSLTGPYAALYVRGNVTTNSTPHQVTLQILCKPYSL